MAINATAQRSSVPAGPEGSSAISGGCWCQGSPWKHQWRNRVLRLQGKDGEPYCEAARAALRAYMAGYMNADPARREAAAARKRLERRGTKYMIPELDPL